MNKNILVFGKGFIGTKIRDLFHCNISTKRINCFADAEGEIKKFKPKIIINCIGYTGKSNVDDCERDKDKTLLANTYVPMILADVAFKNNIKFIHISSGCIYHYNYKKDRPVLEAKTPDYFNLFYSRSKIYAERALEVFCGKHNVLIVRIRVPLDNRPHPRNLLTKLLIYKKAISAPNSVTYIPDFLKALNHLIKIDARGIYNVVNKGGLKYFNLLKVYKKYVPSFKYGIIDFKELNLSRTNVVLSTHKIEKTGFKVRNINGILEECVKNYIKY